MVAGFDVRPAAREQVLSLGATFVGPEVSADYEGEGGYARTLTAEEQARTREALAAAIPQQDLLISTAQVPGRRAPVLVDAKALRHPAAGLGGGGPRGRDRRQRRGDASPASGWSWGAWWSSDRCSSRPRCRSTRARCSPATCSPCCSTSSTKEGALKIDPEDEITKAMLVTLNGQVPGGTRTMTTHHRAVRLRARRVRGLPGHHPRPAAAPHAADVGHQRHLRHHPGRLAGAGRVPTATPSPTGWASSRSPPPPSTWWAASSSPTGC